MKFPSLWIDQTHIGLKRLLLGCFLYFSFFLLFDISQPYNHIQYIVMGSFLSTVCLVCYAAVTRGICVRIYSFFENGQTYEVVDYYTIHDTSQNYRALKTMGREIVHSKIYYNAAKNWAYLNGFYAILKTHTLSSKSRLLILGGGGCAAAKTAQQVFQFSEIVAVEISATMISVARQFFLTQDSDKHINIIHDDAFDYLHHTSCKFDTIFVDIFTHNDLSNHISTRAFVQRLSKTMKSKGILYVNFGHCPEVDLSKILPIYKKYFVNFKLYLVDKNLIGVVDSNNTVIGVRIS